VVLFPNSHLVFEKQLVELDSILRLQLPIENEMVERDPVEASSEHVLDGGVVRSVFELQSSHVLDQQLKLLWHTRRQLLERNPFLHFETECEPFQLGLVF